jgi:hypothetical protein
MADRQDGDAWYPQLPLDGSSKSSADSTDTVT